MIKVVRKKGTSQFIHLPKAFLDEMNVKINDEVELTFDNNKIIIQKKENDKCITS